MEKKEIRPLYLELGDNENILVFSHLVASIGGGHDGWGMRGGEQWEL